MNNIKKEPKRRDYGFVRSSGVILLALAFIVYTINLVFSVRNAQQRVSEYVNQITAYQNAVSIAEKLSGYYSSDQWHSKETRLGFHSLDSALKSAAKSEGEIENQEILRKADSLLANIDRHLLKREATPEGLVSQAFYADLTHFGSLLNAASGNLRKNTGELSVRLASLWNQLILIAILACALVVVIAIFNYFLVKSLIKNRKVEENLSASEEKYHNLFDNSPSGILIEDMEGNILEANNSVCVSLGYTREELLKMTAFSLSGDNLESEVRQNLTYLAQGRELQSEVVNMRSDGSTSYLELFEKKLTLSDGSEVILVLSNDISKRKRAEEQISSFMSELTELNVSKDKYMSIISHDLRTPFVVFSSFANILRNTVAEMSHDEILSLVNEYDKTVQRAQLLLDNLLAWSGSRTGKMECLPKKFDLKKIIQENVEMTEHIAITKKIKVLVPDDENVVAYADPDMIRTVVRNLLSNSLKFTPEGGRIEFRFPKIEGNRVEVSLIDSGTGIPEEVITLLFSGGIIRSEAGTADEKGSGIGLHICRELIEKNKGEFHIENLAGKGSRFSILLPMEA